MNKLLQVAIIVSVVSVIITFTTLMLRADHATSKDDAETEELIQFEGKDLEERSVVKVSFVHSFVHRFRVL